MSLSDPVKEFAGQLDRPENQGMIEFLKLHQPSAHADMVELLVKSAADLPDVKFYCPDTDNYAYYLAHTRGGVMFAAAIGLSALMFRLPKQAISGALVKGGEIIQDVGDDWVSFNPFWPEQENKKNIYQDMQHWCRLAFHHAVQLDK
ncbi:MAG: hypothetical protein OEY43_05130 [Gammaproteobacteria bacterium]|nr:hypothetical protein [Gammaproteobacteria bacterium]